jgi:hypothetical protein
MVLAEKTAVSKTARISIPKSLLQTLSLNRIE